MKQKTLLHLRLNSYSRGSLPTSAAQHHQQGPSRLHTCTPELKNRASHFYTRVEFRFETDLHTLHPIWISFNRRAREERKMVGSDSSTGSHYSGTVGAMYVFNLIVGGELRVCIEIKGSEARKPTGNRARWSITNEGLQSE